MKSKILLFIGTNWVALWVLIALTALITFMCNHSERQLAAMERATRIDTVYVQQTDTVYAPTRGYYKK